MDFDFRHQSMRIWNEVFWVQIYWVAGQWVFRIWDLDLSRSFFRGVSTAICHLKWRFSWMYLLRMFENACLGLFFLFNFYFLKQGLIWRFKNTAIGNWVMKTYYSGSKAPQIIGPKLRKRFLFIYLFILRSITVVLKCLSRYLENKNLLQWSASSAIGPK